MASIHRQPGKPNWFCAFTTSDGKRHFRSTGTTDKKEAGEICRTWAKASLHGDQLTPDKARHIIAAGVADIMAVSGQKLPNATVRQWAARWLEVKAVENEPSTHERYDACIRRFLEFLEEKADKDLTTLRVDDVTRFRDKVSSSTSASSANLSMKIVRACLQSAVKQELVDKNVAKHVPSLRERPTTKRRAFTKDEVKQILKACDRAKGEWRGLVLTGVYTGQRLGDIAKLKWSQVDLIRGEISFLTQKTGNRLCLAMAKPLRKYLEALPSTDDVDASVFPKSATIAAKRTGTLSNKFYDGILVPAGLVPARSKKESNGAGRDGKRQVSELSFHSFRHTLTTWLKAAGASNALAQFIVGHESAAVSRDYTHLSGADTAESIAKLPDVTR